MNNIEFERKHNKTINIVLIILILLTAGITAFSMTVVASGNFNLDIDCLLALQSFRHKTSGLFDKFFLGVTEFGTSYITGIVCIIVFYGFDSKLGLFLFQTNAFGRLVNGALKLTACIYRPWIRSPKIKPLPSALPGATGYSFPSGHSTNASTVFLGISYSSLSKKKQNIILQGAPGVGKTFAAKRLAYSIIGSKDENRIETIQFHQSYSYEDFIMGYKPSGDGFELQNGVFYKFCQRAANNPDLPYFFIIDEINRGNLSKIFGELLMLIEKEYRGTKAILAYNGLTFSVPKNVYIIGMMNTADRSLAMIDYALRRRFSFYSMEPGFTSEGFQKYMKKLDNETFNLLIDKVMDLNTEIIKDSSLGSGFCIGHSYFCNQTECTDEWMQSVVEYDIIPTLEEYWFDDTPKLQRWQNILRGVFND